MNPLKAALSDWTSWTDAEYYLGELLGLFGETDNYSTNVKHVIWSDHPVGNILSSLLHEMAEIGILEYRDEPDQEYRWNAAYQGTWQRKGL